MMSPSVVFSNQGAVLSGESDLRAGTMYIIQRDMSFSIEIDSRMKPDLDPLRLTSSENTVQAHLERIEIRLGPDIDQDGQERDKETTDHKLEIER